MRLKQQGKNHRTLMKIITFEQLEEKGHHFLKKGHPKAALPWIQLRFHG